MLFLPRTNRQGGLISRQVNDHRSTVSYQQLHQAINRFLPARGLATCSDSTRVRWTDRLLVFCAILMAWEPSPTLKDRFAAARQALVAMFPGRRRPGGSYAGFIGALVCVSASLLERVLTALRRSVCEVAMQQGCWETEGYICFGVDGSKIDCPMTVANEQMLGCASRQNSGPQQLLTILFHAHSGLIWAFTRGVANDSERSHLLQMLRTLPTGKRLLLADAGFTGYEVLKELMDGGHALLIRVGANVHLLRKLGYCVRERGDTVYLWPEQKQKENLPPLTLRLISLRDGRNRVTHLLTNLLEDGDLSEQAATRLYKMRWGVELLYRSFKQTLARRKMLSDNPVHAQVELDWSAIGLCMLELLNAAAAPPGQRRSVASALRAVRGVIGGRRGSLCKQLAAAVVDRYHRTQSKRARHWPHKKQDKPPGDPKARTATELEVQLAKELRDKKAAA